MKVSRGVIECLFLCLFFLCVIFQLSAVTGNHEGSLNRTLDDNATDGSEKAEGDENEFITNATTHRRLHHYNGIPWFRLQMDHVAAPLTLGLWLCIMTVSKTVIHKVKFLQNVLPESAQLIALGLAFGGVHFWVFPDQELYLHPDIFFLVLLPPIVLDAGYSLQVKEFYHNIGTILTYAVVGTIFNTVAIGLTLTLFRGLFANQPSIINLFQFATLISAVDPVAVICVFDELQVNRILHICVFGESLLNDAVSVVLYNTLNIIADVGVENLVAMDYVKSVVSFFTVSLGGMLVGLVWALGTALMTKWSHKVHSSAFFACLIYPYMSYVCAEAFGVSGILAAVVCGIVIKPFVVSNVDEMSKITLEYSLKTLSSSSEALIFIFLGISSISRHHDTNFPFIMITLVSCLLYRFLGVYSLTYFLNLGRLQKISLVDQFIMAFGGIRGAVCYGLVMSLDTGVVPFRNLFATTVVAVILFTVFIQGGTIKHFVKCLNVEKFEKQKKRVFDIVTDNMTAQTVGGLESIIGLRGDYWLLERINKVVTIIKPFFMLHTEDRGAKLVKCNEEIQVNEAMVYLRKHGSFAGMPTVQSRSCLLPESRSMVATKGAFAIDMTPTAGEDHLTVPTAQRTIPRNQSITSFVQEKLSDNKDTFKPNRRYSRHFLETDLLNRLNPANFMESDSLEKEESTTQKESYLTFPCSRSSQKDLLIANIRKASRPNLREMSSSTPNGTPPRTHVDAKGQDANGRPQFFITSDTNELVASTEASKDPHPASSYHIGRFEVEHDSSHRKNSVGKSQRGRAGTGGEEATSPLMPIVEQDEKTDQNTSF